MAADLALRCECGSVRGVVRDVSAEQGNRVVCYCDDCQTFARFLASDRTLDARGGTDIFQISSGRVAFSDGIDRLACLRLTRKGPLRWYAACCGTPIGNTMATRAIPFIGLIHAAFDRTTGASARDALLGPVRARIFTRFAQPGGEAPGANARIPAAMIFRLLRIAITARLRGDHRRSPFFDAATGEPIANPRLLDDDDLRRARAGGTI